MFSVEHGTNMKNNINEIFKIEVLEVCFKRGDFKKKSMKLEKIKFPKKQNY